MRKKLASAFVLALMLLGSGCALTEKRQEIDPQTQKPIDRHYPNPELQIPLEAVRDLPIPYAEPLAGIALSALSIFTLYKNRRLKKTAKVLTENVGDLLASSLDRETSTSAIKGSQESAGVRGEVDAIRKN